ncbi:MAG: SGNH/GDSL hydrolase family protein [Myxococcota bacterium]|nr:SGNH/GDSL hydrolase family protein [Myxococcota bacterium]
MPIRKIFFRIFQVLCGIVVGIILAEGFSRLVSPMGGSEFLFQAPENAPNGMYVTDKRLLYKPNPGFQAQSRSPGYCVPIRINENSLRGAAVGEKKKKRWLAVGDSFTFAAQVSEEDSFLGLLNQSEEREFLNAGADGYGTWQAQLRYKELDKELDLDGLLVVFFIGNDFHDNQHFQNAKRKASARPSGQPILAKSKHPVLSFLSRRSHLYAHWKIYQRAKLFSQQSPEQARWYSELMLFTEREMSVDMMQTTEKVLRDTQWYVDNNLMVAIAAPYFVVEQDRSDAAFSLVGLDPQLVKPDMPTKALIEVLERLGIAYCDLTPDLRSAYQQGEIPYLAYDGHWSRSGHRIVAQTLSKCFADVDRR